MAACTDAPGRTAVFAVPVLAGLLPILGIHASYALGAYYGHYGWCVPYLPDCVSISATGRHPPGSAVFRAAVIPGAVLMLIYWTLTFQWQRALGAGRGALNRVMLGFGLAAAVGLLLYAAVLGEVGERYELPRRLGVMLFYAFTILAQILLTVQVTSARRRGAAALSAAVVRLLMALVGAALLLGSLSLLSWAFYDEYRRLEDAFEWTVTALLTVHPLVAAAAWRQTGFGARFAVSAHRP